jgi:two-component system, LytTR family, sensor histidine kinase AlgZ
LTFDRVRLAAYALGAAVAVAMLASVALLRRPGVAAGTMAIDALVPAIILGILGLAARFPVRATPLRRAGATRLIATHAVSAAAASSLWLLAWRVVAPEAITADAALVLGVGVTLYLAAVIVHYLVAEVETAKEAEEAALRFRVLAREAELRAFKAQVDPHFLFNSLNAVAALCGSRPADARTMAQLMADFFRLTLRVGSRDRITVAEEIDLVSRYLAIEKVRFGARLSTEITVDDAAAQQLLPPLLLQPLVENAVRHGIASMVDGGTIVIAAAAAGGALRIVIDNPADPDRVQQSGEGIGLQNARGRLAAISGGRASLRAEEKDGRYRVEIELPPSS